MALTRVQRLKFELLSAGMRLTGRCERALATINSARPLTPADYASTSGLILRLEEDVWVNAPVALYNPNFVVRPDLELDVAEGGTFVLRGHGLEVAVRVWLPPAYPGRCNQAGRPLNDFVYSHGDRVRLAPIGGCAMACKFCNIPYEDPYVVKPIDQMVEAVRIALGDSAQPARHILISGGTPRSGDVEYLRDVYRTVLTEFSDVETDIMMVPVADLFDLEELRDLGLHELSVNIEVHDPARARELMPHKARQGLGWYLRFIERATSVLGEGRVRSMLMVGLEPPEHTLAGVQSVIDAGGVPVLSPFRPDPATPLRDLPTLSGDQLAELYLAADALALAAGAQLGPDCGPCTHNTLTFVDSGQCAPGRTGDQLLLAG